MPEHLTGTPQSMSFNTEITTVGYWVRLGWNYSINLLPSSSWMLRFPAVTKTMLVPDDCLAGQHLSRSIKASLHTLPLKDQEEGVGKRLDKDIAGVAEPNWSWESPYYTTSCPAIKTQGMEEERSIFSVMEFLFQNKHHMCWGPAFQRAAGHLLTDAK